ncbi:hypothetical protein FHT86_005181 [Rhizobium sp. BK313]|jgi:hypothetical protein|uniref:hypothetical protein n=1 Tax=Rhizobium sp. BK313 TaxID=2587081 RepID=UPI001061DD9F|nr:hypothetical protein [Rhizobium sp. BK313]MBB3456870.1 hypothetical protein [Rhizobium sp. BK313]
MLLKTLAISALVIGVSSAAMAGPANKHRTTNFDAQAIQADIGNIDHSKDAILPDGTINMDPSVVGPGRKDDFISRLQCDARPNTMESRSNTYNLPLSGCP